MRPLVVRGESQFQLTRRTSGKETHENLSPAKTVETIRKLFGAQFAHAHLFTSEADYSFRVKSDGTYRQKKSRPSKQATVASHNRSKNYLIPEDVPCPFLIEIGIMNQSGKVRAAKYQKFRQINRFLELVNDVLELLPSVDCINVVDFGCGRSYLTFAIYHLFTAIHKRKVHIVGLDWSEDVIRECSQIANKLAWSEIEFRVGDIASYTSSEQVHLAVSLHACDTATDDALAKAIKWESDVILSVPCCQHELHGKVHNDELIPLEQHGILSQRLSALVTDALRAQALEICGYKTQIVEFIDLEHTKKNLLIRAIRRKTGEPHPNEKIGSYQKFKETLGIGQIYLEEVLAPEFLQQDSSDAGT